MKIKLIPVSRPELDVIEIDKDVFFIGKLEDPFISFDNEITADLSRRHAKIFTENDHVFIIDLESLNGTTLNDLSLGTKPLPINDGDVVDFAKHLAYRIEFVAPELNEIRPAEQQPIASLTLEPVDKHSGLDILVITGFPFLISKEVGVFAAFNEHFASKTSLISRRHAYILEENNELKLVDMSSTNGTFINSEQIDDVQPSTLKNGDIISFACDFFTYVVKLGTGNQSDIDASVLPSENNDSIEEQTYTDNNLPSEIEPKTTFVNEPSPFLDILCNEVKQPQNSEKNSQLDTPVDKAIDSSHKKQPFVVSFIQKCWSALADEKPKKSYKKAYLIILTLACIAGGTAYLYLNANFLEINSLINSGKYADAAALSIEKLKSDPNSSALKDLSITAILNTVVPGWLKSVADGQYAAAKQTLQKTKNAYTSNPDIARSIELLQWSSDMHQFMAVRNDNETIFIFKDKNKINELLSPWDNNRKQNKKNLAMIARKVPSFKPYYEQFLSDVRSLENDRDLYLKATDTLLSNLLKLLKKGQVEALSSAVTQFENKYTSITGLDDLKIDIYNYIELREAVDNKEIERIAVLNKQYEFKTPLFIKYTQQTFKEQLPSEQFTNQYTKAVKSWETGEIETAINLLLSLSKSDWGLWAQKKLERYKTVLNEFSELKQAKGTDKYVARLFNFHAMLNLPEDKFFLKTIYSEFQNNKQIAIVKAREHYEQAKTYWDKYTDNNGIDGLLRLENHVSDIYQEQAGNLSAASQNINDSLKILKILHMDTPNKTEQLSLTVRKEIENQRKWLIDLELIIKPEILKKKLDLLITP